MQETQVPSLGREDPLEEEMATHSSILAWRIPWTEDPGGLQSMGLQSWTRPLPMPKVKETWVSSLGQEDPLEEDIGTHSSIFA